MTQRCAWPHSLVVAVLGLLGVLRQLLLRPAVQVGEGAATRTSVSPLSPGGPSSRSGTLLVT